MQDSLAGRLTDLIVKPARLMEHVAERPQWYVPGLILVVIMGIFTWVVQPITGPEQMELTRDSKMMQFMTEEQWQQQYEAALDPSAKARTFAALGAGVWTFVMVVLFGLVLGFFARMSSGTGTMKQSLGVVAWSSLIPFGVAMLIKAPLILITESMYSVQLGLAAFIPNAEPMSPIYQVLTTYGDFFTWWGLVLLVIGFERVHGLTRGAAVASVLLPWALTMAVPLVFGLIFM